eukprot:TRINITY_DN62480_c0_g1_i2.p1 TRINITY_DN62480_c0_g1~~TRINITY_DN62480_c0_g1_i2.p1  ORF type:complete len:166 (-),score=30.13 TRINITY_DN62480_c0_g1_i2:66-563(-)
MIRRPPRSTLSSSSAASDVYKRQTSKFPRQEGALGLENVVYEHGIVVVKDGECSVGGATSAGAAYVWSLELGQTPATIAPESPRGSTRFSQGSHSQVFIRPGAVVVTNPTEPVDGFDNMGAVYILSLIHISEPTRLLSISYAVFCLKKKKKTKKNKTIYIIIYNI